VVSAEAIQAELGSAFEILRLREFKFDQVEGDGHPGMVLFGAMAVKPDSPVRPMA
jgi:hypothetical protein